MKSLFALLAVLFSASHAADWYAGARVGHALIADHGYFSDIEKPLEVGAHAGISSKDGLGGELGFDYIPGETKTKIYYEETHSEKFSRNNLWVAFCAKRKITDNGRLFVKAGPLVSFQSKAIYDPSYQKDNSNISENKFGGVASVGAEYIVLNCIGINSSIDTRVDGTKSVAVSLGVDYLF